jgi:hypothetical protein
MANKLPGNLRKPRVIAGGLPELFEAFMDRDEVVAALARHLDFDEAETAHIKVDLHEVAVRHPLVSQFLSRLINRFVPADRIALAAARNEDSGLNLGQAMVVAIDWVQSEARAAGKPKPSQARIMKMPEFIKLFRQGRGNRRGDGLLSISRCEDLIQKARKSVAGSHKRRSS